MRLLRKLKFYGIADNTHAWISDFLRNRSQKVLLDGISSETSPVQSGVPQGSVLGPLLFLLFINDLPDTISSQSTVKLFADDCVLYRKIKCRVFFPGGGLGGPPHPAKILPIPPIWHLSPFLDQGLSPPQPRFVPENLKNLNSFLCQIWPLLSWKVH